MEYITGKLGRFANYFFTCSAPQTPARKFSRYDAYMEFLYKVLSWENPNQTLAVFLLLNFLFWLTVQLELRLFGVIFLLLLIGFLCDSYFERQDLLPRSDGFYVPVEECKDFIGRGLNGLLALRKESPSSFCFAVSLFFLVLSFIAKSLSGYILTYFTLLVIFFLPLGISLLPEDTKASVKQAINSINLEKETLAEEELMPFIALRKLEEKDNDLDSLLTDKTLDSVTNSLISGLSVMPSYLDEDTNDILEEDLLPVPSGAISVTPGELSTDSDSDHKEINFDSSHFNGDSSSDDEHKFGRGLRFSQARDVLDGTYEQNKGKELIGGLISNVASVGSNIVSVVANLTKAPRKNSSSDSEFEMIDSEELE